jgi:NTE family protein
MIAFVLSGGGSQGALQVGALQALLERNIHPDMVVSTSVGAVNSILLAQNPSLEGIAQLTDLWRQITLEDVYPGNYATALWRLARGAEGLYPSENLKNFLTCNAPDSCRNFADIAAIPLYVVATRMPQGTMHVFGDDPQDDLLSAVMASTALPPLHPPYQIEDQLYLDGSLSANLPLRAAVERGATEIYALYIYNDLAETIVGQGALSVAHWSVMKFLTDQVENEVDWVRRRGIPLHLVCLKASEMVLATDFGQSQTLIAEGYQTATTYLEQSPYPQSPVSPRERLNRLRESVTALSRQAKSLVEQWLSPNVEQNI